MTKLDSPDKTMALRQSEADHRLANSLAFLSAALRHQARGVMDPASRNALVTGAGRVAAMARVHRFLTEEQSDRPGLLGTRLKPFCADLADSLDIEIKARWNGVVATPRTAGKLGIVINELATNAKKHGGLGTGGLVVSIAADRSEDGMLRLTILDNGVGLPRDFNMDEIEGLGMTIVKATIEDLGGSFKILRRNGGAAFELRVPIGLPASSENPPEPA